MRQRRTGQPLPSEAERIPNDGEQSESGDEFAKPLRSARPNLLRSEENGQLKHHVRAGDFGECSNRLGENVGERTAF